MLTFWEFAETRPCNVDEIYVLKYKHMLSMVS